jgi:ABC-type antimicrobial peptide transport system permease subunit
MVAWAGLRLIAAGLGIGLLGSFLVSRVVTSQLWGVSPHDPLTLSIVVAVLMLCGLTACYIPALRATRVEPVKALRLE